MENENIINLSYKLSVYTSTQKQLFSKCLVFCYQSDILASNWPHFFHMQNLWTYRLLIDQRVLGQNNQDKDNLRFLCKHHNLYYTLQKNSISGFIPNPVLHVGNVLLGWVLNIFLPKNISYKFYMVSLEY